jgi:hypothetical protein
MQRKPILPLGAKAPWVLAGLAIALAAWGVWTGNDQMVLAGVLAATIGLVVFRSQIGCWQKVNRTITSR